MAQVHRHILWFDVERLHVDYVEVLAELENVARILHRAGAFAPVEIAKYARPADATKLMLSPPGASIRCDRV